MICIQGTFDFLVFNVVNLGLFHWTCLNMACSSKMASRRVKSIEIWESRV